MRVEEANRCQNWILNLPFALFIKYSSDPPCKALGLVVLLWRKDCVGLNYMIQDFGGLILFGFEEWPADSDCHSKVCNTYKLIHFNMTLVQETLSLTEITGTLIEIVILNLIQNRECHIFFLILTEMHIPRFCLLFT